MSVAVGAATDGVVDAAAVGTVPLPFAANTSTQITGSTASIFLVMANLLYADLSRIGALRSTDLFLDPTPTLRGSWSAHHR